MIKTYLFSKQGVKEDVPLDNWQSLIEGETDLLWVDVRAYNRDELDQLADKFNLHSLEIDSCLDGYDRPHIYEFQDHFYLNLTVLEEEQSTEELKPEELHLFAGDKFIITAVHRSDSKAVEAALKEFKESPQLCDRGAIYAVYMLAEDLVETYYPIVESLDDQADQLESELLEKADKESVKRIFVLKRKVFELRKLLGPQRDMYNELARRDFPFIQGEDKVYFQDVYNRMVRIFDMIDTIREILSGSLDIYLSQVSNRLNEVMKFLASYSIILMFLSLITGFYGMNFRHFPTLGSPHAISYLLIGMGALTAGLYLWFRRKGWV